MYKLTAFGKLPCLPLSFSFASPSLLQIPQPLAYITYKKKIIYQEFVQVWYLDMFGQDQVILNFSQQYPVLILPKVDP